MSPVAWRGNQLNRISVREFCNALCAPVSRTTARTHKTRRCGRYCFTARAPRYLSPPFENSSAPCGGLNSERSRQLLLSPLPPPLRGDTDANGSANEKGNG